MHLYFTTRGVKMWVDKFIADLQGKYLPWEVKEGAAGHKKGKYNVNVAVRPIQLWEVVFPEEHLDLMLTSIHGKMDDKHGVNQHKFLHKFVYMIRKALKLKPIPKKWDDKEFMPLSKEHVEITSLGMKEDYKFEDGTEAL